MTNPLYQRPSSGLGRERRRGTAKGGIVNYIPQEENILCNEPAWHPTGLILASYHMNDFQKSARRHPGRKFVNHIMQGDEAPVTYVQPVITLEDKRNNPKSLGPGQPAGGKVCIKSIDQVLTKLFPKADIEFHRQTIEPRGLTSGHT